MEKAKAERLTVKQVTTVLPGERYRIVVGALEANTRVGRLIAKETFSVYINAAGDILNGIMEVEVALIAMLSGTEPDGIVIKDKSTIENIFALAPTAKEMVVQSVVEHLRERKSEEVQVVSNQERIKIDVARDGVNAFVATVTCNEFYCAVEQKFVTAAYRVCVTSEFELINKYEFYDARIVWDRGSGMQSIRTEKWSVKHFLRNKMMFLTVCDAVQEFIQQQAADVTQETTYKVDRALLLTCIDQALDANDEKSFKYFATALQALEATAR